MILFSKFTSIIFSPSSFILMQMFIFIFFSQLIIVELFDLIIYHIIFVTREIFSPFYPVINLSPKIMQIMNSVKNNYIIYYLVLKKFVSYSSLHFKKLLLYLKIHNFFFFILVLLLCLYIVAIRNCLHWIFFAILYV